MTPADAISAPARPAFAAAGGGLIDVHHHHYPPFFLERLREAGAVPPPVASWSPDRSLEDMDRAGVSLAVVSLTSTGVELFSDAEGRRLAREANEYAARMMADRPGRFGLFGHLPLPDIDAALTEIARLFDDLGADGVCLFTSYRNRWLGHESFAPVLEELSRRRAVVFVHPTVPDACRSLMPGLPDYLIEFPIDTARTIASLVTGAAAARHPGIRFLFAHAGGVAPVLSEGISLHAADKAGALAAMRGFHYDTALRAHPPGLAAVRELAETSRILLGTDFPFRSAGSQIEGLAACGLDGPDMAAVGRANALRLLDRRFAGSGPRQ